MRRTINLHERVPAAARSVALLPPRSVPKAPPVEPEPQAQQLSPTNVLAAIGVGNRAGLLLLLAFAALSSIIITAFGTTGVVMLVGMCVALRLMFADRS
ncbi:hypothetical protein [Umezawaea sp. Da 62-37]|uniref:hypothetical protein n=1 Tax=Umezawaea sp. Da 62-37 TaxID=3075927 RepID=UPI0028F6FE90|nr:hypothetical protein [Umezawaea sp. Da 62-37]WNV89077.1 hypothetical protein RM788_12470 [Umezawaea sp. Da 62-37]